MITDISVFKEVERYIEQLLNFVTVELLLAANL